MNDEIDELIAAIKKGDLELVKKLIKANPDMGDVAGFTPLMIAVMNEKIDIIKYILSTGVEIWDKDIMGWTAFHHAAKKDNREILSLILDESRRRDGE